MITPYKILLALIAMIVTLLLFGGAITYYDSPQVATALNATAMNGTHSLNSFVFTQLNSTAFGGTNHTSGFFAQVTVFSGLAFVFSGFGFVMQILLNMPVLMIYLIALPVALLGFPIGVATLLMSIFVGLLTFILIIEGISAWMKYQLRGND
jgi:hypothetical protein